MMIIIIIITNNNFSRELFARGRSFSPESAYTSWWLLSRATQSGQHEHHQRHNHPHPHPHHNHNKMRSIYCFCFFKTFLYPYPHHHRHTRQGVLSPSVTKLSSLGEKMLSRIVPNVWEITQRILGILGDDGVSYIWRLLLSFIFCQHKVVENERNG